MQPMRKFSITLGSSGLMDPSVCRQAKYFFKHTTTPHPCWAAPEVIGSVTQVREMSYSRQPPA